MATPEVRSTLERNECVRRYTASMPNDAFTRLVDRVAGNARSGASWAEGLLYHWLDAERSDTKRTVLLQEMVRSSFLGCPFECLTRLAAVRETNVSSRSAELLVMAGPAGEQALIRALPGIRGAPAPRRTHCRLISEHRNPPFRSRMRHLPAGWKAPGGGCFVLLLAGGPVVG
ncbi:hypothetical protein Ga0074812_101449 [Parafrankia irregularis]|uniref:Uncharacterized protein n=1 Tax=Parafrankia irregularis TaxID=795642 RepID=A0A0S4QGV5_9ACTN|nr:MULTISPECIES: hypothetical protein [Parafrankia]MBE3206553.1 hypothetical protein [Parafrankia sp. CH37]CUU53948.1 hypothetical protein Ga0074812_101449 [Parafrankia irregularis]